MRRIILLVVVALVMAAMMSAMAMPAFAVKGGDPNGRGFGSDFRKDCAAAGGTYIKVVHANRGQHFAECDFTT